MKLNSESYCHDCGSKIMGEEFYCDECFKKNGLNKFNILAFLLSYIQPLFALLLAIIYPKRLNPGIYKSCIYGVSALLITVVIIALCGFVVGFLGLA